MGREIPCKLLGKLQNFVDFVQELSKNFPVMGICRDGRYWNVYLGTGENGKLIRKRTKTLEEAKRILAEYKKSKGRYDIDLLGLPEAVKVEIFNVMKECSDNGMSLTDLLQYWKDRNISQKSVSLSEAARIYSNYQHEKNLSAHSHYQTKSLFTFLQKNLGDKEVSAITLADLQQCFFQKTDKSKKTFRNVLVVFLNWCVKNGYAKENLALQLEVPKIKRDVPVILTLPQIRLLLRDIRKKYMMGVIVMMFLGVRPHEAMKLKENALNMEKKTLTIGASIAKTRSFRVIKLPDVAVTWIERYHLKLPLDCCVPAMLSDFRETLGLDKWPQDCLRHTAASMMLARDQSADKVALQLGNSPTILHRHYKNLVTEEEAAEFWALTPENVGRPLKD